MPDVLFVATGRGRSPLRAWGYRLPDAARQSRRHARGTTRRVPLLALGKVRYVGQPVAFVVAETLSAARDAAEAIEVEYEPLPVVTEAQDAIAPGAPQLFDHIRRQSRL